MAPAAGPEVTGRLDLIEVARALPVPQRHGLNASRLRVGPGVWSTARQYLQQRFAHVNDWDSRISGGLVLDATQRPITLETPCRSGDLFWYWRAVEEEVRNPAEVDILYRDERIVVVDKPHGLPVVPGGRHLCETILVRLQRDLGMPTLAPAHRLDLETAGVLLLTTEPAWRGRYQTLFQVQQVEKIYEAVVHLASGGVRSGWLAHRIEQRPGTDFMQMQVIPGPANARTEIEPIRLLGDALAHYRLKPRTGRKHQLRVQLSHCGMPIVGDRIYPDLKPYSREPGVSPEHPPLQLLARSMAFIDPVTRETRCFTSRQALSALSAFNRGENHADEPARIHGEPSPGRRI